MTAVIVERLMGEVDSSGPEDPAMRSQGPESPPERAGAVAMEESHRSVEPAQRNAGGSNPSSSTCKHPKDRQRPVVGGKLCLDCKRVLA